MQNLDFSKKIKRAAAHPGEAISPAAERVPEAPRDGKSPHRHSIIVIVLVFVSFAAGLMAGIQWSRVSHIEENLVRYPDEERSSPRREEAAAEKGQVPVKEEDAGEAVSLADMGNGERGQDRRDHEESGSSAPPASSDAAPSSVSADRAPKLRSTEGRYIIKVGDFPSDRAADLTARLNDMAAITSLAPHRCRGVHESVPDRYLTFRTRVKGKSDRENILVGCFAREKDAREILQKIRASGPAGARNARIFEIQ